MHTAPSGDHDSEDRGQSAVIGYGLMIAMALLGTVAVIALGSAALTDTQTQSSLERAEHQMTLFDSRAAMVALSDSDVQTVQLGQGSGSYRIEEGTGRMTITHVGFTDDSSSFTLDDDITDDGPNDDDHEIYSAQLGSAVYEHGDTKIAYQGGGVWRVGSGDPRMISPPEFHYRGATLTLPVIHTTAGDTASGAGTVSARVSPTDTDPFTRMYPDPNSQNSQSPYPDSDEFRNPVQEGFIVIEVESEYYEAWANYFRERTDGTVKTWASNETARLELVTIGDLGSFTFGSAGDTILIRGKDDGYSVNDFQLEIYPNTQDSSKFNNLQWSLSTENARGDRLEIAVSRNEGGGSLRCDGDNTGSAEVHYYYYNSTNDAWEGWTAPVDLTCTDYNSDGDDEARLDLDFTSTSTTASPSTDKNDYDLVEYGFSGSSTTPDFDDGITGETDIAYSTSDSETLDEITNHYFALMGSEFTFNVNEGNNAGLCYAGSGCEPSGGSLTYDGNNRVVTYLHITENRIEVSLN